MVPNRVSDERVIGLRMSECWFHSPLDLPDAEEHLHRVVRHIYPGVYIEGPRLRRPVGPFVNSRRQPDFAASLITGQMYGQLPPLPVDAHIELRLYGEPNGATFYYGIGVLGRNRPRPAEEKMLAAFVDMWRAAGQALAQVPDPEYAI